ncbi:MAG: hypothetical protein HYS07_02985 [Chlamydiae bacterium]|nr:hypothetical protein [Chlamydiota bacterium]
MFVMTPHLLNLITEISEQRGFLEALSLSTSIQTRLKEKAANEEAYYSSHIEGARSSLEEALRFIKKREKYSSDESLQMMEDLIQFINMLALSDYFDREHPTITKPFRTRESITMISLTFSSFLWRHYSQN